MRRAFRRPRIRGRERRDGVAMVEVAVGLMVFLFAMFSVIDTAWALYHYIALNQASKTTVRYAGTNLHTRNEITREFYRSVGPTLISSTDSLTSVTITTVATDPVFANLRSPSGLPSVTVEVRYRHQVLGPWPVTEMTLVSSSTAIVSTWEQVPVHSF